MFLKRHFLLLVFILATGFVLAQTSIKDTVIQLNEIEIKNSRLEQFAIGTNIENINSQQINLNNTLLLTDILSSLTAVNIKSYGIGGVASMSLRGGTAAHTAVIWNGINLQSPMSGMANLSTIPGFMVSNISVQQGGSGTLFGSGAAGGVIHLNTEENQKLKNYISAGAGFGNFGWQNYTLFAGTQNKKTGLSVKSYFQKAENNFPFKNTAAIGAPLERQTNAAMRGIGIMPEFYLNFSDISKVNITLFYQDQTKEIQTQMTDANRNEDIQEDNNLFLTAAWKYIKPNYSLNFHNGYINTKTVLFENKILLSENNPLAVNTATSFINEFEGKFMVSEKHLINAGVNSTLEKGESFGYIESVIRYRFSIFASYKISELVKGLNSVISFRKEFGKNQNPFIYSMGNDFKISKNLVLKGSISKNYRIPAFNDLHWKQDTYARGNPNLKPETGWSGEAGINEQFSSVNAEINLAQTFFLNNMNDLIIWLPDAYGIWMPDNKEKAISKGMELKINGLFKFKTTSLGINSFYSYTNSKINSNDQYNNKPLIYIPKHRFNFSSDLIYSNYTASFNMNYNGSRYFDNSHKLQGYILGNFIFSGRFQISKIDFMGSFRINNIWNTSYQAMAWYAMPLRNYQVSFNFSINNKNK